jgi:hypothetical protein
MDPAKKTKKNKGRESQAGAELNLQQATESH